MSIMERREKWRRDGEGADLGMNGGLSVQRERC